MSPRRDLDRLADMRAALGEAGLQGDLEALLGCRVQVVREGALRGAPAGARDHRRADGARQAGVRGRPRRSAGRRLQPRGARRDVIAQRNVVVHEYHRLDLESLWATASSDLPELDDRLAEIERAERDPPGPGR